MLTAYLVHDVAADYPNRACELLAIPVIGWLPNASGAPTPVLQDAPPPRAQLITIAGDRTPSATVRTQCENLRHAQMVVGAAVSRS
jgi:hypothetical protein